MSGRRTAEEGKARPLIDREAREAALDTGASIILQAPAGSGKTTILTQRFLALLTTVEEPESILAMTFTRKAAAEMRGRILAALRAAAVATPPGSDADRRTWQLARAARERAAARGWRLEEHPARLRILTIDGLNRSLAAAMPLSARGTTALELVEQPEELYREVARRTLEDAETDPQVAPHSGHAFALLDNRWDRLEGMLAGMLQRRAEWLRHVADPSEEELRAAVERTLSAMAQRAVAQVAALMPAALRREGQSLAAYAAQNLREVDPAAGTPASLAPLLDDAGGEGGAIGATLADLPAWRALAEFASTSRAPGEEPALRKKVDVRNGFPPSDSGRKAQYSAWVEALRGVSGLDEALAAVHDAPEPRVADDDLRSLVAIAGLLRYAAAQLLVRFREIGQVDHVEVAAAAQQALLDDQGVDGSAPGRIVHQGVLLRHILVDEFQDTSMSQFQLLQALVADWSPGDGRTLFAVGDPMQSIYQFREAEVALFLRAREQGLRGGAVRLRPLSLQANFRSQRPVVDFVNEVFATVLPPKALADEAAVPYLPFDAHTDVRPLLEAAVTVHALRSAGNLRDAAVRAADEALEASRVRQVIEGARAADPGASIAVLVSARSHAAAIADSLREAGIPVQGVDLVPLADTAVVQDLVALTRALLSATDRIAWLSVLRAPWCALSLQDLTLLVDGASRTTIPEALDDPTRIARLPTEAAARLGRVQEALKAAIAATTLPIALRVESLWLQLDGPRCYADPGALDDARRYLDVLAADTAGTGRCDPARIATLLAELYAGSDSIAAGAVQIMTIHRAKGLEFDVVLLPGLARPQRNDEAALLEWLAWQDDDGAGSLLLAPTAGVRAVGEKDPRGSLRSALRLLRRSRARRERARLLYVAMTRARCALHLFATLGAEKTTGGKAAGRPAAPGRSTALGVLWGALGERFSARWSQDPAGEGVSRPTRSSLRRLRPDATAAVWPQDVSFQRLSLPSAELVAAPETGWASDMARLAGTVVHRELERLARTAPLPDPAALERERPRLRALLEAEGVAPDEIDTAVDRVVGALHATLSQERGRWMLSPQPVDDFVEHELTGVHEGRIENIVIDRTFVDAAGDRWVIDYKTTWHEGGDLETFIAGRRAAYAPQLRKYRAFAARLGPQPVRTALYFPLLGGRFEEYDPG